MVGCTLETWSTSGVSLATGLTGCVVLLIREWRRHLPPLPPEVPDGRSESPLQP
jgi:hypothetical protein